ncbi:hypothetical protein CERSUDRAFT_115104 [Gelatoporia subvermispora B]|uniref:Uncharacterized protein n=1 Tax=Ceriporiopsis subvermispora (strain B) TaxID=914234 RepID=M2PLH2_CERS8|nr:hypothetical protein CERSUDRAFT_115104 [Gelatoporia subvermispora B]
MIGHLWFEYKIPSAPFVSPSPKPPPSPLSRSRVNSSARRRRQWSSLPPNPAYLSHAPTFLRRGFHERHTPSTSSVTIMQSRAPHQQPLLPSAATPAADLILQYMSDRIAVPGRRVYCQRVT